jgi:hypothetical protein
MTPLRLGMTPLRLGMTPLPVGMTPLPVGMTPLPVGMTRSQRDAAPPSVLQFLELGPALVEAIHFRMGC